MSVAAMVSQADIAAGDLDQARREKGWTEARTRIALALFNAGLSAAEIAGQIGGVSRNAVIGKVHRSGLSEANRKKSRAAGEARAKRHQRIADADARRPVKPQPPKEVPLPPSIIDQQIPLEQRRTLAQLDDSCCHWPVRDPRDADFFFCGAPKPSDDGIPYCPSHLFRSRQREARPHKPVGAAFLNAGQSVPWRAR